MVLVLVLVGREMDVLVWVLFSLSPHSSQPGEMEEQLENN